LRRITTWCIAWWRGQRFWRRQRARGVLQSVAKEWVRARVWRAWAIPNRKQLLYWQSVWNDTRGDLKEGEQG
jgi:hypothetical protein